MLNTSKKIMVSGAVGNALEIYDLMMWGVFAVFLSKEFLPPQSAVSDILFVFLLPYIIRPLGGLFGGILADKFGRKNFLTKSIFLMGICTALVGILPSYEQVGVLAVFLLLTIKIVQMFSAGGEYISSISLLIESCDRHEKGFFGSWAEVGVNAGMLAASLTGALILYLIDNGILPSWGWRLAFLFALINTTAGVWIRRSIPESRDFISYHARIEKRSVLAIFSEICTVFKERLFDSFLVFSLVLFGVTVTVLIFVYFPMHLAMVNQLSETNIFLINSCALVVTTTLIPFMGALSDKYGRAPIILTATVCVSVLVIPYFACLQYGTLWQILTFHCLMAIPCAAGFATRPVFITEIFPLSVRCSVVNLIYSLAACLGGGITPFITTKLTEHGKCSPGIVILAFGIISSSALVCYMVGHKQKMPKLVLLKKA